MKEEKINSITSQRHCFIKLGAGFYCHEFTSAFGFFSCFREQFFFSSVFVSVAVNIIQLHIQNAHEILSESTD